MSNNSDQYKAGQDYAKQNPFAEKPTESQVPTYDERISRSNGMDSAKKDK